MCPTVVHRGPISRLSAHGSASSQLICCCTTNIDNIKGTSRFCDVISSGCPDGHRCKDHTQVACIVDVGSAHRVAKSRSDCKKLFLLLKTNCFVTILVQSTSIVRYSGGCGASTSAFLNTAFQEAYVDDCSYPALVACTTMISSSVKCKASSSGAIRGRLRITAGPAKSRQVQVCSRCGLRSKPNA